MPGITQDIVSLNPHNRLGFPSTDEEAEAQKVT